jgi:hypothetical protein
VPPGFHRDRISLFEGSLNSHARVGNIPNLAGKDGERRDYCGFARETRDKNGLSVSCEAVASEGVFSYINTKVSAGPYVSVRPFGCEEL